MEKPKGKDRIIFAADVDGLDRLEALLNTVGELVPTIKIGLEVYSAHGPVTIHACHKHKLEVFLDLKLHDIPTTVAKSIAVATKNGVKMVNVHALGASKMITAARRSIDDTYAKMPAPFGPRPLLLAVTILTSHSWDDLIELGLVKNDLMGPAEAVLAAKKARIADMVVRLARLAKAAGADGVVCSPHEIKQVRAACGEDFLIVTPGVRPLWAPSDDQARAMTPGEAVAAGADYLVIGRPISKPPDDIGAPEEAVRRIVEEIEAAERPPAPPVAEPVAGEGGVP